MFCLLSSSNFFRSPNINRYEVKFLTCSSNKLILGHRTSCYGDKFYGMKFNSSPHSSSYCYEVKFPLTCSLKFENSFYSSPILVWSPHNSYKVKILMCVLKFNSSIILYQSRFKCKFINNSLLYNKFECKFIGNSLSSQYSNR